ncbi:hypothetical protein CY35_18G034300 [Sphagnum magellanicum]|nr:hypothetical protein CY35_18G034300 [Sphagnum magellanicum]
MGLLTASNWIDQVKMRDVQEWQCVVATAWTVMSVLLVARAFYLLLWKPYSRRRFYEKQGIRGPCFRPIVGNLPEIRELRASLPEVCDPSEPGARRVGLEWFVFSEKYGKVSIFEQGSLTRIILADAKLAKEVLVAKAGHYHKAALNGEVFNPIAGIGSILTANEGDWKQKNHIMSPAFRHTFLENLFHHVLESGNELVTKWQTMVNNTNEKQGVEVAVDLDVPETLLDIIVKTTFGSTTVKCGDMYAIHKAVRFMFKTLGPRLTGYGRLFPGYNFLPTPTNIKFWIEKRYMEKVLKSIVSARWKQVKQLKGSSKSIQTKQNIYGSDLLGLMFEAMEVGNSSMTAPQLLDQCKTMIVASDAPTSMLLIWTLTLLAMHPDWQERARFEVQEVVGEATPELDMFSHLKLMDMVLNETMRFIPPVASLSRDAIDAHQIGSVSIAAGTNVIIPLSVLNHNKEVWGNDAHLFNPGRWDVKNRANNNFNNFMPFGGGNRMCLGRNLARMEAKLLLSVLLRRFTFSVAPGYVHSPGVGDLVLWPKFGAQLRIKNVDSYTSN